VTLIKVLAYAKIFVLNLVIIIHQYHAKVNKIKILLFLIIINFNFLECPLECLSCQSEFKCIDCLYYSNLNKDLNNKCKCLKGFYLKD
jgi:hypothetical protein